MGRSCRIALLVALLVSLAAAMATAGAASADQLYAFGWNHDGQLGNTVNNGTDKPNPAPAPVALSGATGQVTEIAAGAQHSLALTSTGQLYAFGNNRYGQLGNTTNTTTSNPNPIATLVALPGASGQVSRIAAGDDHSLAVTSSGQLYAFGDNHNGQLGNATNNGASTPNSTPTLVTLPGASGQVSQIAAGVKYSLALTSTGEVYGFGDNFYGQLGTTTNSGTGQYNPTPRRVTFPGASGQVTQIAAGEYHSLALTSSGQLYAFGSNRNGELGTTTNNGTDNPNATPTLVTLPGASGPVTQITAGNEHTLVLTSSGQLYAFGLNFYGELGKTTNSGTTHANATPTLVTLPGASGQVGQIAAGQYHSLALTSSGQLYAFGYNAFGQLGSTTNSGTENANPTPTPVTVPGGVIQVLARGPVAYHTLVAVMPLPAPSLSALGVTPHRFSITGRKVHGRCVKPTNKNRRHKHCTRKTTLKISYTLNTPATVTAELTSQSTGRKVKGRCVKTTHHNRKHKHCKLTRQIAALTQTGTAGNNTLTLSHKLKPGSYTLTLTAGANGHTSSPQSASVKIIG